MLVVDRQNADHTQPVHRVKKTSDDEGFLWTCSCKAKFRNPKDALKHRAGPSKGPNARKV